MIHIDTDATVIADPVWVAANITATHRRQTVREAATDEMYSLLREYWRFRHSELCVPWFPHEPDDPVCQAPEPDILKNGPDAPYRY